MDELDIAKAIWANKLFAGFVGDCAFYEKGSGCGVLRNVILQPYNFGKSKLSLAATPGKASEVETAFGMQSLAERQRMIENGEEKSIRKLTIATRYPNLARESLLGISGGVYLGLFEDADTGPLPWASIWNYCTLTTNTSRDADAIIDAFATGEDFNAMGLVELCAFRRGSFMGANMVWFDTPGCRK